MNKLLEKELLAVQAKLQKELDELREKKEIFFSFEYLDTRKMTEVEKTDYEERMKKHFSFGKNMRQLNKSIERLVALEFSVAELEVLLTI
jgi:hypothetical protein